EGCCPQWSTFARHRVERAEAAEDLRPSALGVALGGRDAAGSRQSDRLLADAVPDRREPEGRPARPGPGGEPRRRRYEAVEGIEDGAALDQDLAIDQHR